MTVLKRKHKNVGEIPKEREITMMLRHSLRMLAHMFWRLHESNKLQIICISRHLDRCDRMIQNECTYAKGSNVRLFSAATCTSQYKLRSLHANARLSALICTFRVSILILDCNCVFAIMPIYRLAQRRIQYYI